jgi:guanylate kinase
MDEKTLHSELLRASRNYQVPVRAVNLLKTYHPLIIAGVTASGKNAIISYIMQRAHFEHVVTHTTRPMRSKEKNGSEHWFVDEQEMLHMLTSQKLIESQPIHGDFVYGTSFSAFEKVINSGKKPLMELDIQGINELTSHIPQLEPLFILPPSFDVWMERLGGRDFMSDGEKARRLRSARVEIEEAIKNRNFILIINHEVDDTAHQIMSGVSAYAYDQPHNYQLAQELIEYLREY